MKKYIHINQHKIKSNHKNNKREPVITVKTYKSNDYGHQVHILGECKVVYRPDFVSRERDTKSRVREAIEKGHDWW